MNRIHIFQTVYDIQTQNTVVKYIVLCTVKHLITSIMYRRDEKYIYKDYSHLISITYFCSPLPFEKEQEEKLSFY